MCDEYFDDLPLTMFREEFDGLLPILSDVCWIRTLAEFLGAHSGLKRLEPPLPSILLQTSVALELLDKKRSREIPEEWEAFEKIWFEDDGTRPSVVPIANFTPPDPSLIERSSASLPPNCLLESLFSIRNQGNKSSCVAHAVASAIEYSTGEAIDDATTQNLFVESRSIGGVRGKGSFLKPTLVRARDLNLWKGERVVLANDTTDWKRTLVGVDGAKASPIIAAFGTFASWLYSKSARLSGKWTLPLPEEPCVGGHAVLVVGYQDDPSVPGGGYFVARNSWGEEYACNSLIDKPGCALIPYAYVRKYCVEAYAAQLEKRDEFEAKYVRALDRDARDFLTEGLNAGTNVVAHPSEPDVFLLDAPENRSVFRKQGFAWTRDRLVRNYFPALNDASRARIDARSSAAQAFVNGVKTNLESLVGTNSPFSTRGFLGGVRRIRAVREIDDLSEQVRTELARVNGAPAPIKLLGSTQVVDVFKEAPKDWKSALETSAIVKIWRVDDGKNAFAVVAIWLAPLRFSPEDEPTFEAPTATTLKTALEVVDAQKDWQKEKFEAICKSFGTFEGSWQGLEGVASGAPYAFSTFESGRWRATTCESVLDERTRALVPYLRPTTLDETTSRVKGFLERERFFRGDFTVEFVARKSETTQRAVETAFNELVKNGEYEIYRTARGELACRKRG